MGSVRIVAILASFALFLVTLELVRRKRLKEQYSFLWLAVSLVVLVLALWEDVLIAVSQLIGSASYASTIFFFGLFFVMLLLLQQSVKISDFSEQIRVLTQEIALLQRKLDTSQDTHEPEPHASE